MNNKHVVSRLTISSYTPKRVPGRRQRTETLKPFYQLAAVFSKPKSWRLLRKIQFYKQENERNQIFLRATIIQLCPLRKSSLTGLLLLLLLPMMMMMMVMMNFTHWSWIALRNKENSNVAMKLPNRWSSIENWQLDIKEEQIPPCSLICD